MKQFVLNIMSVCVCILALAVQHANRLFSGVRHFVTCGLSGKIFGKKIIKHKICVLNVSLTVS